MSLIQHTAQYLKQSFISKTPLGEKLVALRRKAIAAAGSPGAFRRLT